MSIIPSIYNNMVVGCSINRLKCWSQTAPTAPSTTRWSQLSVTERAVTTECLKNSIRRKIYSIKNYSSLSSSAGMTFRFAAPMAKMHDWGGLIMAVKWSTLPYIPKFETVKVPPWEKNNVMLVTFWINFIKPEIHGAGAFLLEPSLPNLPFPN